VKRLVTLMATLVVAFATMPVAMAANTPKATVYPGHFDSEVYDADGDGVLVLRFSVTAVNADICIDASASTGGGAGVRFGFRGVRVTHYGAAIESSGELVNGDFVVRAGQTETFRLTITVSDVRQSGFVSARLTQIRWRSESGRGVLRAPADWMTALIFVSA